MSMKHQNWVLGAVCLLGLMSTVGVAMPYPILAPIFVGGAADRFTRFGGLDPQVLMGIALAANPLGILLGSLVVGPMSDRHGRRNVLAVTLSLAFAFYLLTAGALAARSYPLFVLARLATGLTEGNVAVARALLADLGERHEGFDRTRAFALLNAFLYAGWLVGPLLGGLTLPLGEPVPFVVAAVVMVPCLVLLWLGLPKGEVGASSASAASSSSSSSSTGWWARMREGSVVALLRRDRTLALVAALQLAYTLGLNSMYEYAPLWMLENAGFGSRGIAIVTAGQCALMTLASVFAGRFGRQGESRHALRRASLVALVAALGLASLAVLPGPAGIALLVVLGVPTALFNAVMPAWISERFAAHGQGRVMGLLSTIFCLSNVVVALAGGWLALLSTRWIMGFGGVACIVASWLMLRLAAAEVAGAAARPLAPAVPAGDAVA
jgi:MFS family permease